MPNRSSNIEPGFLVAVEAPHPTTQEEPDRETRYTHRLLAFVGRGGAGLLAAPGSKGAGFLCGDQNADVLCQLGLYDDGWRPCAAQVRWARGEFCPAG